MHRTALTFAAVAALASPASADRHDASSCFDNAAYRQIASRVGIDVATAREVAASMPQMQDMLVSVQSLRRNTEQAVADGLDKRTIMTVIPGMMSDMPVMAAAVATCIDTYY